MLKSKSDTACLIITTNQHLVAVPAPFIGHRPGPCAGRVIISDSTTTSTDTTSTTVWRIWRVHDRLLLLLLLWRVLRHIIGRHMNKAALVTIPTLETLVEVRTDALRDALSLIIRRTAVSRSWCVGSRVSTGRRSGVVYWRWVVGIASWGRSGGGEGRVRGHRRSAEGWRVGRVRVGVHRSWGHNRQGQWDGLCVSSLQCQHIIMSS